jgi:5'(3')-deoxyribonucleotidase
VRILVDIDDTIFPWFDNAHQACVRAGITNGRPAVSWWPWRDYDCSKDEWVQVIGDATIDGSLYSGPPVPGAAAALASLLAADHSVHLVTARGFMQHGGLVRKLTVDWVRQWGIPHTSLTFTQDKTMIAADLAVDDAVANIEPLEQAGVACWLMDAAHNKHVDHPHRVYSITEFAEEVLAHD